MSSGLSIKERLEIIDEIRLKINRASNLLSGHLGKITTKDSVENREHVERVKREIRTILTQLARFSELCKKSSKNTISQVSLLGSQFTTYQSIRTFYHKRRLIEHWASHVLTLTTGIDVTKWPLELEAGIEVRFRNWINAHFRGRTKRSP